MTQVYLLPTFNHFKGNDMNRLKVKKWKFIFNANSNQKKIWVILWMCVRVDIRAKDIIRDKERCLHKVLAIQNAYESKKKSFKMHDIKTDRYERSNRISTFIFWDFNTLLSIIIETSRQKPARM